MKPGKNYFECSECEYQSSKWNGKCPSCGSYNTFEEKVAAVISPGKSRAASASGQNKSLALNDLESPSYLRVGSGMSEFDRVLGGGIVQSSVVLLSGEPGIGKSTLLMQLCGKIGNSERVLYVSGEESGGQLKLRAKRLGIFASEMFVLNEIDVENVLEEIDRIKPSVVIIDSIQTMTVSVSSSSAGSVTQIRESASYFISKAKSGNFSVILVGHVNKEGSIAGPKVLEHMVDAVLYFEGERQHSYRIIRAAKNRFGSTNEIGVFEMTGKGLEEVPNPSEAMLKERPQNVSGSCAVCIMEGSRPIITEIQALVTPSVFSTPKRTANGMDYNRLSMLLAVLEKRLGLHFSQNDVYLNVTGGLNLYEPAADLAICFALISGILDKVLPHDFIAVGEIGLAGECRSAPFTDLRINEASRLGFKNMMLSRRSADRLTEKSMDVFAVKNLFDAIRIPGLFLPKSTEN